MAHSKIEEIIVTTSSIGRGDSADPYRSITQYFSKDGSLLFERDEWLEVQRARLVPEVRNDIAESRETN